MNLSIAKAHTDIIKGSHPWKFFGDIAKFKNIFVFGRHGVVLSSLPNLVKPEMTNYKLQITNKFQISNKIQSQLFGILNLGHCYLFGICDLYFEILNY
jgi:hypothetical protein